MALVIGSGLGGMGFCVYRRRVRRSSGAARMVPASFQKSRPMIKRRTICHIFAAMFGLLVVAPITLMRLDNAEPIRVTRTEMYPSDVSPGQTARLTWDATEHRVCNGIIHRRFVDSAGVIFEIAPVPSIYRDVLGGHKSFGRDIVIPHGMAPGPAVYGGTRRYWCNPLQKLLEGWLGFEITVPSPPVKFTVVPK